MNEYINFGQWYVQYTKKIDTRYPQDNTDKYARDAFNAGIELGKRLSNEGSNSEEHF